MSSSITIHDIDPAHIARLQSEARQAGLSMEESVRRRTAS